MTRHGKGSGAIAAALLACVSMLGACGSSGAPEEDTGEASAPVAEDAWVRLPVPGSTMAAGYLRIRNPGTEALRFTTVHSPAFEAGEIHDMQHEGGMMRMRRMSALEVAAGESVSLEPHGMHLMLLRPTRALAAGDAVTIVLRYQVGGEEGELVVEADARAP